MSLPVVVPPVIKQGNNPFVSQVFDFLFNKALGSPHPDFRMWYPIIPSVAPLVVDPEAGIGRGVDGGDTEVHYMSPIQTILNYCFCNAIPSEPHEAYTKAIETAPYNQKEVKEWIHKLRQLDYAARQSRKVLKQFAVLFSHTQLTTSQVMENQRLCLDATMGTGLEGNSSGNGTKITPFSTTITPNYSSFTTKLIQQEATGSNPKSRGDVKLGPISRPIFQPLNFIQSTLSNSITTSSKIPTIFAPTARHQYQEPEMHESGYIGDLVGAVVDVVREYESYLFSLVIAHIPAFSFYQPKNPEDEEVVEYGKKKIAASAKIGPLPEILGFFEFINRNVLLETPLKSSLLIDSWTSKTSTMGLYEMDALDTKVAKKDTQQYITPLMAATCSLDVVGTEAYILCGALFSHELAHNLKEFSIAAPTFDLDDYNASVTNSNNNTNINNSSTGDVSGTGNSGRHDKRYFYHPLSEFLQPFISFTMNLDDDGTPEGYDIDPTDFLGNTYAIYLILLKYGVPCKVLTELEKTFQHPLFLSIIDSNSIISPNSTGLEKDNKVAVNPEMTSTSTMSILGLFVNMTLFYLDSWQLSLSSPDLFPLELFELILQLDTANINNCPCCDLIFYNVVDIDSTDSEQTTKTPTQQPAKNATKTTQSAKSKSQTNTTCILSLQKPRNQSHYSLLEVLLSHPYLDTTILYEAIISVFSTLKPYTNIHSHPLLYLPVLLNQDQQAQQDAGLENNLYDNIPLLTLSNYYQQQQKDCMNFLHEAKEKQKDYLFGLGQSSNGEEENNGVVENTRTGQVITLYSSFQLLRSMYLAEKLYKKSAQNTNQNNQIGPSIEVINDPTDENNQDVELKFDPAILAALPPLDLGELSKTNLANLLTGNQNNSLHNGTNSEHQLPANLPSSSSNLIKSTYGVDDFTDPLDRLAVSIDKANKTELENGKDLPSQSKTFFNEHLTGFDFSNFRRYMQLHDVVTSYEQHNINIGNVEEEKKDGEGDQDGQNADQNGQNTDTPTNPNSLSEFLSTTSKELQTKDNKSGPQNAPNDQDFMKNVLQSLFSSQNMQDSNFKKVSRRDLDRELEALGQIQREHSLLVDDRIARQTKAAREKELEKEKMGKVGKKEQELGRIDNDVVAVEEEDVNLTEAQQRQLFQIVQEQDQYISSLKEMNSTCHWNGEEDVSGDVGSIDIEGNFTHADDDFKSSFDPSSGFQSQFQPPTIDDQLSELTKAQDNTSMPNSFQNVDPTNPFTTGRVMIEEIVDDDDNEKKSD